MSKRPLVDSNEAGTLAKARGEERERERKKEREWGGGKKR